MMVGLQRGVAGKERAAHAMVRVDVVNVADVSISMIMMMV
jgi:hypothetical protein